MKTRIIQLYTNDRPKQAFRPQYKYWWSPWMTYLDSECSSYPQEFYKVNECEEYLKIKLQKKPQKKWVEILR